MTLLLFADPIAGYSALTVTDVIAAIAVVITLMAGIGWIIFNTGRTYQTVQSMKPKVDKIPLLEIKVGSIATFLAAKHEDFQMNLYTSESPQVLTEFGEKVLGEIGGKKFIDDNIASLIEIMDEQKFKSALDVETYAPILVAGKVSEWNGFTVIKNYIYNKPKIGNLTLDLNVASRVMGLYLRDKYLEKYPELKGPGAVK